MSFQKGHTPWILGNHHSQQTKDKICVANQAHGCLFKRGHIPWTKGKTFPYKPRPRINDCIPWNKGIPLTQDVKDKLSVVHKGKHLGENNSSWKGGVSSDRKYLNELKNKWRKKFPLKVKLMNHRRRILTKDLTLETIQKVYEDNIKQFGTLTCYLCLNPIPFGKDHLEHKIPLSRNGSNQYENLEIACQKCNLQKRNKTEKEFRDEVQFATP